MGMPGSRGRSLRRSSVVLAAVLLASGCGASGPKADPVDPGGPASSSVAAGQQVGRWTKLDGKCPALTGDTAKSLKLPDAGKPGAVNNDSPAAQIASCEWKTGPGSVGVLVRIDRSKGSPTAEESAAKDFQEVWEKNLKDGEVLYSRPEAGIEDKAYLGVAKDRATVVLALLSSNARISIYYHAAEMKPETWDADLTRHRETMRGLAADVLNDLR